jgi:hypothetical protein
VRAAGEPAPLAGAVDKGTTHDARRPETEAPADDPEGPGGTSSAEESGARVMAEKKPPELDARTATRAAADDAAGANGVKRKFPEPETEQNEAR